MKRLCYFLLLICLMPHTVLAASPESRIPKTRISAILAEYRHCEGVEMVRLGRISTAAVKGVVRVAAAKEPDAREALQLMKGVKSLYAFEYEDCKPSLREQINRRLSRALGESELLMEANDAGDRMRIYGLYDERTEAVRDFVVFSPSECTLICLFGSIPMETVSNILNEK